MVPRQRIEPRTYRAYTRKDIDKIPQLRHLDPDDILAIKAVSAVLPFRVNPYVVEDLIDWRSIPEDPIYQLTFPQEKMLDPKDFERMIKLVESVLWTLVPIGYFIGLGMYSIALISTGLIYGLLMMKYVESKILKYIKPKRRK